VIERFGRIDVLVNNAGMGAIGAVEESSVAQAQDIFNVNVFGVMRMTKAVLPHMRARGRGRIIKVREYGVRALLVEPAYTSTGFEASSPRRSRTATTPPLSPR
jgi:NAD(P)-dependent dehydrogenase (short-subunit alcohol dehydrogenase family)